MTVINYGDHSCDLGFRVGSGTPFLSLFLLEKNIDRTKSYKLLSFAQATR